MKRVQPLECEEPVRGAHQRCVVVPAQPRAALVMVESEFALELLVVELDLPAHARQTGEPLERRVGGQV